ncbi:MAG: hypothetical protein AB1757_22170 [Acidobacteriota bacterium]
MKTQNTRLWFFAFSILATFWLISCSDSKPANNANTPSSKNANTRTYAPDETPANAKPMGSAAPGFYTIGDDAEVKLQITAPKAGEVIAGNAIAPTFSITDYPIYKDVQRNRGQSIHVVLDNEPYYSNYNLNEPFKAADGKFDNLKEGLHILRAFPAREWHESIKKEDGSCFAISTFYVKNQTRETVDLTKPLLTYSKPAGEYRWQGDPRGVMIDFYVSNARIGQSDFKVRYSINNGKPQLISRWDAKWIKWEELSPGEFTIVMDLVDKDNKHVPFKVGNQDFNQVERTFKILAESERPSKAEN